MRCPNPACGLNAGSWCWGRLSPPPPRGSPACCPALITAACGLFPVGVPCLFGDAGTAGPSEACPLVIVWPCLLDSMAWPCLGAVGIERCCGPCILHPRSHERCVGFPHHPAGKHSRFSFQRTAEPLGPLPHTIFPGGGFKEVSSVVGCFDVCGIEPGGTHPSSSARC